MTLDILESSFSVMVPELETQECAPAVTVQDACQAEKTAQVLWSHMQNRTSLELAAIHDSIGHYPLEDSSYCGSLCHGDEDAELGEL